MSTRLGVISDTHGLVRPEALRALEGVERILHLGDVGQPGVLSVLASLAPVTAVRGNVDRGEWADALPETEVVEIEAASLYLLHDLGTLDLDPAVAGFSGVLFGHSHRPGAEFRDDVLYLNPGSAGPRRFKLPLTVALLIVSGDRLDYEIIDLEG